MKQIELKNISFFEFKAKLIKNSNKLNYKVKVNNENLIVVIDNNWLGINVFVNIYKLTEKSFLYEINLETLLFLILVLLIVLFFLMYNFLLGFMFLAVLLSLFIYITIKRQSERYFINLFENILKQRENDNEQKDIVRGGLFCPGCGESLTEFDEFCPSCELFLGKVNKKQFTTRTWLYDFRLEYHFKKSDLKEN